MPELLVIFLIFLFLCPIVFLFIFVFRSEARLRGNGRALSVQISHLRERLHENLIGSVQGGNSNQSITRWHVLGDKKTEGPYSDEQLEELIRKGFIARDDLLWKNGLDHWMSVTDVFGSLGAHSTPSKSTDYSPNVTVLTELQTVHTRTHDPLNSPATRVESTLISGGPTDPRCQ